MVRVARPGQPARVRLIHGYDVACKLIYLRARYYDPSTGQFISRDPLVAKTREPYAYTGDNPLNATDPTGLENLTAGGSSDPSLLTYNDEPNWESAYPAGFHGLSGKELEVCVRYAWDCGAARQMASTALDTARLLFSDEGEQAAFRHTYWSALMAAHFGCGEAQAFGDAHEYASTDPQLAIDRAYHNNAVGRSIGGSFNGSGASDGDIEFAVLAAMGAGRLDTRTAVGQPGRFD